MNTEALSIAQRILQALFKTPNQPLLDLSRKVEHAPGEVQKTLRAMTGVGWVIQVGLDYRLTIAGVDQHLGPEALLRSSQPPSW